MHKVFYRWKFDILTWLAIDILSNYVWNTEPETKSMSTNEYMKKQAEDREINAICYQGLRPYEEIHTTKPCKVYVMY